MPKKIILRLDEARLKEALEDNFEKLGDFFSKNKWARMKDDGNLWVSKSYLSEYYNPDSELHKLWVERQRILNFLRIVKRIKEKRKEKSINVS